MKVAVISIAICLISWFLTICLINHFGNGSGYVSIKTEEKYLRNIDKFMIINKGQYYVNTGRDSLSYGAHVFCRPIDPFHTWFIKDVGVIRPYGKLSKALDSMAALFKTPPNPYK